MKFVQCRCERVVIKSHFDCAKLAKMITKTHFTVQIVQRCFIQKHWSKMSLLENMACTEIRKYIPVKKKHLKKCMHLWFHLNQTGGKPSPENVITYMIIGFRLSCRHFSLAGIAQALFSHQVKSSSDHSNMFY